ncbi:MAG: 3-hydroxyacyl-CoA dehydrogenase NAD-binding domain-containing protein, partial [Polaromonas sp.]
MEPHYKTVGVVGTGAMGRGIAQIAAQAGSKVILFDAKTSAATEALAELLAQWDKLVTKGRMEPDKAAACKGRVVAASQLTDLAPCDLIVEAIVERLDVKKTLFAELESVVSAQTVLATNTSSLSVTAIAAELKHAQRVAGYHFFNPVPLMKVVEVIAGLRTDAQVCTALAGYARQMG